MSYYYVAIGDTVYSTHNPKPQVESIPSPYNFLTEDSHSLHSISVPFSLMLTTVTPDSPTPFRLTILSPGHYIYTELSQQEYEHLVLNRPPHRHNTYEIVYTREGEFFQQIETKRYKYTARSCCLLNRNIRHKEEYTSAFSLINLSISADFLKGILTSEQKNPLSHDSLLWQNNAELKQFFSSEFHDESQSRKSFIHFIPTSQTMAEADIVHDLLDQMAHIMVSPAPGDLFLLQSLICKILFHLTNRQRYSTAPINLGTEAEDRIFAQITQLMESTHGRISRRELSERLNYSGDYLNKIVNKYTGMSIFQYGNSHTMQYVAWLLTHSDMTVSQIIAELGFTDRTHFYQLFRKEYGETPREFRLHNR